MKYISRYGDNYICYYFANRKCKYISKIPEKSVIAIKVHENF